MAKWHQPLFKLAILILVFIFVLLLINPILIFHHQQLGFSSDAYLLKEFASYPGGLVEYASTYLFQSTTSAFWGAALYAFLIGFIVYFTHSLLRSKKIKSPVFLKYIPSVLLAYFICDYSFPLVFPVLVLITLILLIGAKSLLDSKISVSLKIIYLLILIPIAYYLLAGFMFYVFAASILILLLFNKQKGKTSLFAVIVLYSGLIPYLAAKLLFFITIEAAYFRLEPFVSDYDFNKLVYLFLLSIPLVILIQKLFFNSTKRQKEKLAINVVQYILVMAIFTTIFLFNVDNNTKEKIEINLHAYNGEWEQIISKVDEKPSSNRIVNFQTNRALFHNGKMATELFHYPQDFGVDGLFLTRHFEDGVLLPSTQLCIDMGYVNEAIHWANEAISQNETSPLIIEQLIITNIIANHYSSAQLYINTLKKFPFFHLKALEYEQMVENNSPTADMLKKRSLQPTNNFMVRRMNPASDLKYIVLDVPKNKMAFEYLMSYYLMDNNLAAFYQNFPLGKAFYGNKIPRVYEEALVSYLYELNKRGMEVPPIKLSDAVLGDFSDYITILKEFKGNYVAAKPFLQEKFKNTYWFYLNYTSPVTRKAQLKTE